MYSMIYSTTAALALALVIAGPASAQCSDCDLTGSRQHQFAGDGGPTTWEWGGFHSSERSGHCWDKHWDCAALTIDSRLLEAIRYGSSEDVAETAWMAYLAGAEGVTFSGERQAIQVLDCDGDHVVAHLPVEDLEQLGLVYAPAAEGEEEGS